MSYIQKNGQYFIWENKTKINSNYAPIFKITNTSLEKDLENFKLNKYLTNACNEI